ncbi:CAP domain-containing protein [Pedobacter heparinus]|uniref:CAP domain-containing protein n=1 Tax=Pedobacter heparinus TaxID=984 RepID=UPI00292F269C|nr:CAP domain-containing protein [Pedobacter heparinus]
MKSLSILLISLSFLCIPASLKAQNADAWTKEELKMANTAGNAPYLTGEEKDIVIYMNLVRMDGERFFNTFLQDFIDDYNEKMKQYSNYERLKISRTDSYYRSLKNDLKNIKLLPAFWPDEALSWVARQHAKDLNKNNFAAHNSSDGRTVKDRIGKMYPNKSNGENLAFGFSTGLGNVCLLLIDKGVPDLGHRKMILNTSYQLNTVGVSIQSHKTYRYCAVIDFVALPHPSR